MRLAVVLAVLMFSGCASPGSWLDGVGTGPKPPVVMSDEQAVAIGAEITRLRAEAQPLRAALAAESDRNRRMELYQALRNNGDRLRPLERSMQLAGRPVRVAVGAAATAF